MRNIVIMTGHSYILVQVYNRALNCCLLETCWVKQALKEHCSLLASMYFCLSLLQQWNRSKFRRRPSPTGSMLNWQRWVSSVLQCCLLVSLTFVWLQNEKKGFGKNDLFYVEFFRCANICWKKHWFDVTSSRLIAPDRYRHEIQMKITTDNLVTELSAIHHRCCKSISSHESAAARPLPVEVSLARETGLDTVHGHINIAQRSKGSQHTDRQQQTSAPRPPPPPLLRSKLSQPLPTGAAQLEIPEKRTQSWLIL